MSKLRKSAQGKTCTLRLGCCNGNNETTVLAHLPSASHGMGLKSPDWWGVYACSSCHDAIDGRAGRRVAFDSYDLLRALHETQCSMIIAGLIVVK